MTPTARDEHLPTILATLPLPEPAPTMLRRHARMRVLGTIPSRARLTREIGQADVLCPQLRDTVDAAVLEAAAPRLRAVCNYAAGYDNIDIDTATNLGILVTNTPDVLTQATADCTLGLIIATARRFPEGERDVRTGRYHGWRPDYLLGLELTGARLALVGFGRIAQAVARRALAFGMHVAFHDDGCDTPPSDLQRCTNVDLDELFTSSDIISLHVPLTAGTHHLVDEHRLRQMKPTAILVNTSRGPVIDEAALVHALHHRWIAGAGLDVYENEPRLADGLRDCPTAMLTPHLGSATVSTRRRMAELTALDASAVLTGRTPAHLLNPEAMAHTDFSGRTEQRAGALDAGSEGTR